jgi:hypothetical protein
MASDTTKHACGRPAKVTDPEIVRRVLTLGHLGEKKAAGQLQSEGIQIGARSIGTIRKNAAKTTKAR